VRNNFVVDVSKGSSKGIIQALGNFGNADVTNNIFVSTGDKDHFYNFIKDAKPPEVYKMMSDNTVDVNVYYSVNNPDFQKNKVLRDLRKHGFDQQSVYGDPLFENWREGNFRLKPESPALKAGIEQIDISNVGLTKDYPSHLLNVDHKMQTSR
jgi:hypothetical protein